MPQRPTTNADRTPEELARAARAGSVEAFESLVSIFEARLHAFLLRRTGSAADAEELAQEAFLRAWSQIDRYDERWRFSTWLYTIASRAASDHVRSVSASRRRERERGHERSALSDDPSESVVRREGAHRSRERIWDLAARLLSPEQHTALWLRYAEDMSIQEIASVLSRTSVSTRVILFRAREALAQAAGERRAGYFTGDPANEPSEPRTPRLQAAAAQGGAA